MQHDVPSKINLQRKQILKADKSNSESQFSKSYSIPNTRKHGKFSSRSNAVITQNEEPEQTMNSKEDIQMDNHIKKEGPLKVLKNNGVIL